MAFKITLWTSFFCMTLSRAVDYGDLQGRGASCYPRDTCDRDKRMTFPNASCECDILCHSYNDCCFDAPSPGRRNPIQRRSGLTCLPYDQYEGVYVIGKCSSAWRGHPMVKMKCEKHDDFSDPLLSIPTTDTQVYITYRNRYCAECNNANPHSLSTWSPTLTCDSLKPINSEYSNITYDFIVQNIARVNNEWGVYHWNQSRRGISFFPCDISFSLPKRLPRGVRRCAPDVVSTCTPNYRRELVRQQCESYMAVVFYNGHAYRNVHCLQCNIGSLDTVQCLPPSIDSRAGPPLSFTLLIDVNPRDGNLVGVTNPCPPQHTYDPFFKKCRPLVCALPGHVLRNGRCVQG